MKLGTPGPQEIFRKPILLRRQIFFFFLLSVFFLGFLELSAFFTFWFISGKPFSYAQLHAEKAFIDTGQIVTLEPRQNPTIDLAIHPYLGYVLSPAVNSESFKKEHRHSVNTFGFIDSNTPIQQRANDQIIVGITGGSVAYWLSALADDTLIAELIKSSHFKNRKIVIVRMAVGGYKQPQQLMALNYILALGGQFDILINIDGFNEVALPNSENLSQGVYPFFPRQWGLLAQGFPNLELQLLVGKVSYLKDMRKKWAQVFGASLTHYSVTLQLLWKVWDHFLSKSITNVSYAIQTYKPKSQPFHAIGPGVNEFNEENIYKELAALWQRSSIQMDLICKANNIQYFHFLQPNQYVEGSKPFGDEERRIALAKALAYPYKTGVEKGYPQLASMAAGLRGAEVNFYDLKMLFSEVKEPLYVDTCCHFNRVGNTILARQIAQEIIRTYSADH